MGCEKIKDKDNKIIGYTCSFVKERGRFLMWRWELHKNLGVCWFIEYPIFPWKGFKKRFKDRLKYFTF